MRALSIASLAGLAWGCSSTIPLSYEASVARDPSSKVTGSVAVYLMQDARPGFKPNVAARSQNLVTAELPITYASDLPSPGSVSEFVSGALGAELTEHGLKVIEHERLRAAPDFETALRSPQALLAPGADYVVFGRINHQVWYHAGFAGLLFQGSMPGGNAYCDLDLAVVSAASGRLAWVGEASSKVMTEETSSPEPQAIGGYLQKCLQDAIAEVMDARHLLSPMARAVPTGAPP